jgi:hypothetical protein
VQSILELPRFQAGIEAGQSTAEQHVEGFHRLDQNGNGFLCFKEVDSVGIGPVRLPHHRRSDHWATLN